MLHSAKHATPQLTLCRHITMIDDQVPTLYTPWTTPAVTVARNSSAHACIRLGMPKVSSSEAEILNFPQDAQGLGWWASDLQVCKWTSGDGPRTETFYRMRPTAGDTTCTVNGELYLIYTPDYEMIYFSLKISATFVGSVSVVGVHHKALIKLTRKCLFLIQF